MLAKRETSLSWLFDEGGECAQPSSGLLDYSVMQATASVSFFPLTTSPSSVLGLRKSNPAVQLDHDEGALVWAGGKVLIFIRTCVHLMAMCQVGREMEWHFMCRTC